MRFFKSSSSVLLIVLALVLMASGGNFNITDQKPLTNPFVDGNEANNYVLTSDASGNVSWALPGQISGPVVVDPAAIITPTETASQNNYDPSGFRSSGVVQVSLIEINVNTVDILITGLAAPSPETINEVTLYNSGSFKFTLKNQDGNSLAANRFDFKADLPIESKESVVLFYSTTADRWRVKSIAN